MGFEPEKLTDQIDGVVSEFTTTFFRVLAQLTIFYNGARLPDSMYSEPDSKRISLTFTPSPGDTLFVWYKTDETVDGRVQASGVDPDSLPPSPPNADLDELLQSFDDRLDVLEAAQTANSRVEAIRFIGNLDSASLNGLSLDSADAGKSYVVTDAGTLSAGSLGVVAGDLVEWDGTAWVKVLSGAGGFVPFGARLIASTTPGDTLISPLTPSQDEGKVAQYGGASLSPSSYAGRVDGDIVFVSSSSPQYANEGFIFDGVIPTGSWVQFTAGAVSESSSKVHDFGNATPAQTVFTLPEDASDVLAFIVGGNALDKTVEWTFSSPRTITFIPGAAGFALDADDPVETIYVAAS